MEKSSLRCFTSTDVKSLIKRSNIWECAENARSLEYFVNCYTTLTQDIMSYEEADTMQRIFSRVPLGDIVNAMSSAGKHFVDHLHNGVDLKPDVSVCQRVINPAFMSYSEGNIGAKEVLLLLRFPSRLTLRVEQEDYSKFVEANRSCKGWESWFAHKQGCYAVRSVQYPHYWHVHYREHPLLSRVLPYIKEVASELDKRADDKDIIQLIENGAKFSNGVCSDTSKQKFEKCLRWDSHHASSYEEYEESTCGSRNTLYRAAVGKKPTLLACVPKNWEAKRVIGEVDAVRQFWAHGVRHMLVTKMPNSWSKSIDLTDQSRSRRLTHEASIQKHFATIDSTSASDRVPALAVKELFPKMWRYLSSVRDEEAVIADKVVKLYCYSTAGNATTFVVETFFFYCICEGLRRYMRRVWGISTKCSLNYGDDILLDASLVDTFLAIASLFNIKVNEAKSFTGLGNYRESCGAEYCGGYDVSTLYWPRSFSPDLANLVSLEQRFYHYKSTRDYLVKACREILPDLTAHAVGVPCSDLWLEHDDPIRMKPSKRSCGDVPDGYVTTYHHVLSPKNRALKPYYQPIEVDYDFWSKFTDGEKYSFVKETEKGRAERKYYIVHVPTSRCVYRDYLVSGPLYDDPLMRLLGVSTSRLREYITSPEGGAIGFEGGQTPSGSYGLKMD